MATMRYLADFPCPHCLVLKSQIGDLGLVADIKRRRISASILQTL